MKKTFSNWHNLVFDMDGVLWHGETPHDGLIECFEAIRSTGRSFMLATNNSGGTVKQYVDKLSRMGVKVNKNAVLSSAIATASYLSTRSPNGARVFAIGGEGLHHALNKKRFTMVESNADYVVVGIDREISWEKLEIATLNIREGAVFVGTNPDVTLPSERGIGIGNGAILAALQSATDVHPLIIGKPQPMLYQQAMARLNANQHNTLAIGDRLDTDILGAERAGISSLLVMTGITSEDMLHSSNIKPNCVLPGMPELTAALMDNPIIGEK